MGNWPSAFRPVIPGRSRWVGRFYPLMGTRIVQERSCGQMALTVSNARTSGGVVAGTVRCLGSQTGRMLLASVIGMPGVRGKCLIYRLPLLHLLSTSRVSGDRSVVPA